MTVGVEGPDPESDLRGGVIKTQKCLLTRYGVKSHYCLVSFFPNEGCVSSQALGGLEH